jgi:hypothetical protein
VWVVAYAVAACAFFEALRLAAAGFAGAGLRAVLLTAAFASHRRPSLACCRDNPRAACRTQYSLRPGGCDGRTGGGTPNLRRRSSMRACISGQPGLPADEGGGKNVGVTCSGHSTDYRPWDTTIK